MYECLCFSIKSVQQTEMCLCVLSVRKGADLQESEQYAMRARGTTLTIHNIKQEDGGSYTCKASNKAGEVQREIFLKVFGEKYYSNIFFKQFLFY